MITTVKAELTYIFVFNLNSIAFTLRCAVEQQVSYCAVGWMTKERIRVQFLQEQNMYSCILDLNTNCRCVVSFTP